MTNAPIIRWVLTVEEPVGDTLLQSCEFEYDSFEELSKGAIGIWAPWKRLEVSVRLAKNPVWAPRPNGTSGHLGWLEAWQFTFHPLTKTDPVETRKIIAESALRDVIPTRFSKSPRGPAGEP